jgi:hypothetical protein
MTLLEKAYNRHAVEASLKKQIDIVADCHEHDLYELFLDGP